MHSSLSRARSHVPLIRSGMSVNNQRVLLNHLRSLSFNLAELTRKPTDKKKKRANMFNPEADDEPVGEELGPTKQDLAKRQMYKDVLKTFDKATMEAYPELKVVLSYIEENDWHNAEKYLHTINRHLENKLNLNPTTRPIIDPTSGSTPLEAVQKSLSKLLEEEGVEDSRHFVDAQAAAIAKSTEAITAAEQKPETTAPTGKRKLQKGSLSSMISGKKVTEAEFVAEIKQMQDHLAPTANELDAAAPTPTVPEPPRTSTRSLGLHPTKILEKERQEKAQQYHKKRTLAAFEKLGITHDSAKPAGKTMKSSALMIQAKDVELAMEKILELPAKERAQMASNPMYGALTLLKKGDVARIKAEYDFTNEDDMVAMFQRFLCRTAEDLEHPLNMSRYEYEEMMSKYNTRKDEVDEFNDMEEHENVSNLELQAQQLRKEVVGETDPARREAILEQIDKIMAQRNAIKGFSIDGPSLTNDVHKPIEEIAEEKAKKLAAKLRIDDPMWLEDKQAAFERQLRRARKTSDYDLHVLDVEQRLDCFFQEMEAHDLEQLNQDTNLRLTQTFGEETISKIANVDLNSGVPYEAPPQELPQRLVDQQTRIPQRVEQLNKQKEVLQKISKLADTIPLDENNQPLVSDELKVLSSQISAVTNSTPTPVEAAPSGPITALIESSSPKSSLFDDPTVEEAEVVSETNKPGFLTSIFKNTGKKNLFSSDNKEKDREDRKGYSLNEPMFKNLKKKPTSEKLVGLAAAKIPQAVAASASAISVVAENSAPALKELTTIMTKARKELELEERITEEMRAEYIPEATADMLHGLLLEQHKELGNNEHVQMLTDMKDADHDQYMALMSTVYRAGGKTLVNQMNIITKLEQDVVDGKVADERDIYSRLVRAGITDADAKKMADGMWHIYKREHGLNQEDLLADQDDDTFILADPVDEKVKKGKSIYGGKDQDKTLVALMKRKSRSRIFEGLDDEVDAEIEHEKATGVSFLSATMAAEREKFNLERAALRKKTEAQQQATRYNTAQAYDPEDPSCSKYDDYFAPIPAPKPKLAVVTQAGAKADKVSLSAVLNSAPVASKDGVLPKTKPEKKSSFSFSQLQDEQVSEELAKSEDAEDSMTEYEKKAAAMYEDEREKLTVKYMEVIGLIAKSVKKPMDEVLDILADDQKNNDLFAELSPLLIREYDRVDLELQKFEDKLAEKAKALEEEENERRQTLTEKERYELRLAEQRKQEEKELLKEAEETKRVFKDLEADFSGRGLDFAQDRKLKSKWVRRDGTAWTEAPEDMSKYGKYDTLDVIDRNALARKKLEEQKTTPEAVATDATADTADASADADADAAAATGGLGLAKLDILSKKKKGSSKLSFSNIDMTPNKTAEEVAAEAEKMKQELLEKQKAEAAEEYRALSQEIGVDPEKETSLDRKLREEMLEARARVESGELDAAIGVVETNEEGVEEEISEEERIKRRVEASKKEAEEKFRVLKQYEVMLDRQIRIFNVEKLLGESGLPKVGELNTLKHKFEVIMQALQTPGARGYNETLMNDAKDIMSKMVAIKHLKEEDPEVHYWRLFLSKMPPETHKMVINAHDMPIDPMKLFYEVDPEGKLSAEECRQQVVEMVKKKYKDTLELTSYIKQRAADIGLYHGSPVMTLRDLRKEQKACKRLLGMFDEVKQAKRSATEMQQAVNREHILHEYREAMLERLQDKVTERDIELQKQDLMDWEYRIYGRKGVQNALTGDMDEHDMVEMAPEQIILNKKLLKRQKAAVIDHKTYRKFTNEAVNPFSVNEILKKTVDKQKLRDALAQKTPQERAIERATREQKRLLKHLAIAGFNNNRVFDANETEEAVVDEAAVGDNVENAEPEPVDVNNPDYDIIEDFDDGVALVNQQRFVYGRVVATYGHRVLVEQVGNNAYAKQSQFFAGDAIEHLLRAAGHEDYQLDNKDNFGENVDAIAVKSDNGSTAPTSATNADGDATAATTATTEAVMETEEARANAKARSEALNKRRRWQCVKSRHMTLLCGDYVFIDPYPARPWNQSAVTSTNAVAAMGGESDGVVRAVFKRHNELQRGTRTVTQKTIAEDALSMCANADHLIVLCSAEGQPIFSPYLIDRYISAALLSNMKCTIVYNKVDLIPEAEEIKEQVEEEREEMEMEHKSFKKLSKKEQREIRRQRAKEAKKAARNQDLEYLAQLKAEEEAEEQARKQKRKLKKMKKARQEVSTAGADVLRSVMGVDVSSAADEEMDDASDSESDLDDETYMDAERLARWVKRKSRYTRTDAENVLRDYERLGYRVIRTSARTGEGLDELRAAIARHHTSVMVGPSGVGKSSLLNALIPDLEIKTKALTLTGHGQHTTTNAALYHLDSGGQLVDTPGAQSFVPPPLVPDAVEMLFPEIKSVSHYCKLGHRCTHISEPGCAVKETLNDGTAAVIPVTIFQLFSDKHVDDPIVIEFKRRLQNNELRRAAANPGNNPVLLYAQRWYRDVDAGIFNAEEGQFYQPYEDVYEPVDHPSFQKYEKILADLNARDEAERQAAIERGEIAPDFANTEDVNRHLAVHERMNEEEEDQFDGNLDFDYDLSAMRDGLLEESKISAELMQSDPKISKMMEADALATAEAMAVIDLEDKVTAYKKKQEEESVKERAAALGVSVEKFRELQARVRAQHGTEGVESAVVTPDNNLGFLFHALMEEREQSVNRQKQYLKRRFASKLPQNDEAIDENGALESEYDSSSSTNKFFVPKFRYMSYVQLVQMMRDTALARARMKPKSLTVAAEQKLEKARRRHELREEKRYKNLRKRSEESQDMSEATFRMKELQKELSLKPDPEEDKAEEKKELFAQLIDTAADANAHKKPQSRKGKFVGSYYGPASVLQNDQDRNPDGSPRLQTEMDRIVAMRARAEDYMLHNLKKDMSFDAMVRDKKREVVEEAFEEADPLSPNFLEGSSKRY